MHSGHFLLSFLHFQPQSQVDISEEKQRVFQKSQAS